MCPQRRFSAKEATMTSKDFTDPVEAFVDVYGRATDDLLGGKVLSAPGVFEGERQFIQFADRDYDVDRHWAFEIKREQCALIVVDLQRSEERRVGKEGRSRWSRPQ